MTLSVSSAAAALETLDLTDTTAPRSLSEQLLIHKEAPDQRPDQQMTLSELQRVLSLPPEAWASGATSEARGSSFIPVTMWMLGALQNRSDAPIERWLVVEPWRLRDVRLFVIDPETVEILDQAEGGRRIPLEERIIPAQEASFPLRLAPGQRLLLVLRIQDKTFSPVALTLHDPRMRARQVARLHDAQVALLGIDDILEFNHGDAKPILLERAPLSLSALARHLEQLYRPLAERGGNRLDTQ